MVRAILLALLTLGLTVAGQAQSVFRWQQAYGSAANEAGGRAVAVPGGYWLLGTQDRLGGIAADLYSVYIDAAGNQLRSRTTPLAGVAKINANLTRPVLDAAGNLVVSGTAQALINTYSPVAYLAKLTPTGDTAWVRRLASSSIGNSTFFLQQIVAADGNYVAITNIDANGSNNYSNYHLLKLNAATGATIWDRPLRPAIFNALAGGGIVAQIQPIGNDYMVFIYGSTGSSPATGILILDTNGQVRSQRVGSIAPYDYPAVSIVDRGGAVVSSSGQSLLKMTAQGDTLWHTRVPQAYQYRTWGAKDLVQEASGGYAVLGESRLLQPGGGANVSALHLVRFSATGQLLADSLLYRPQDTFGGSLLLSATGEYVFSGYTSSGPLGGSDLLMVQVRRVGPLAARAALVAEPLGVYPNPASGAQMGRLPRPAGLTGAATVQVLDAVGRVAWRGELPSGVAELVLPTARLRPGLYVVQLTAPDGRRWSGRWLRE